LRNGFKSFCSLFIEQKYGYKIMHCNSSARSHPRPQLLPVVFSISDPQPSRQSKESSFWNCSHKLWSRSRAEKAVFVAFTECGELEEDRT
jgi:hypothetical protein